MWFKLQMFEHQTRKKAWITLSYVKQVKPILPLLSSSWTSQQLAGYQLSMTTVILVTDKSMVIPRAEVTACHHTQIQLSNVSHLSQRIFIINIMSINLNPFPFRNAICVDISKLPFFVDFVETVPVIQ